MNDLVEMLDDLAGYVAKDSRQTLYDAADEITRQRTTVLDLLGQAGQLSDEITRLRAQNAELVAALREVAEYEIEDGCPCSACQLSAVAHAALAKMEEGNE